MYVRDIMTLRPETIQADKNLQVVSSICEWGRFRHMPVVDGEGMLVGVISQTDLLRAAASNCEDDTPLVEREMRLGRILVGDVMNREPVTIDPETEVGTAARVMLRERINCLPVVDHGRPVGILTSFDLLALVAGEMAPSDA